MRGRCASSRNVGAGCDGRCGVRCLHQTRRLQRTAKSCGPGAATLASIHAAPWWRGNGDNKGRSPGRARISRKAIARGKPGCLGCTCQNRVHSCLHFRTRCCGRSRRPAFPAPSLRGGTTNLQDPDRIVPRECRRLPSALFEIQIRSTRYSLTLPWRGRVDANEMSGGVG
jgi:hypothetical protein